MLYIFCSFTSLFPSLSSLTEADSPSTKSALLLGFLSRLCTYCICAVCDMYVVYVNLKYEMCVNLYYGLHSITCFSESIMTAIRLREFVDRRPSMPPR